MKERAQEFQESIEALRREVAKVVVGQDELVRDVLVAMVGGGNVLLEGVPGLGKTLLVKTLGQTLELPFSRIQFTPDLMPSDISGTNLIEETETGKQFVFRKGPIFASLVLADEINRATPKTQSALLEAMQEKQVTVAGNVHQLPAPFFVLATQNPLEMEGTYPLPEAQVDRFFYKLWVRFPKLDELTSILGRTTGGEIVEPTAALDGARLIEMQKLARQVVVAEPVAEFAARMVLATHPDHESATDKVKRFVRFGSSPRGAQTLILAAKVRALMDGRFNVAFDDIREVAPPTLRHRLILSFEGEAEGVSTDDLIASLVQEVPDDGALVA